ncbi:hypothetical protein MP228_007193 [Amoeboaphelidium protococcarum]|nr:hypothetical protein MP228_007193 [Amoeboaphelidium protococcarum]
MNQNQKGGIFAEKVGKLLESYKPSTEEKEQLQKLARNVALWGFGGTLTGFAAILFLTRQPKFMQLNPLVRLGTLVTVPTVATSFAITYSTNKNLDKFLHMPREQSRLAYEFRKIVDQTRREGGFVPYRFRGVTFEGDSFADETNASEYDIVGQEMAQFDKYSDGDDLRDQENDYSRANNTRSLQSKSSFDQPSGRSKWDEIRRQAQQQQNGQDQLKTADDDEDQESKQRLHDLFGVSSQRIENDQEVGGQSKSGSRKVKSLQQQDALDRNIKRNKYGDPIIEEQ